MLTHGTVSAVDSLVLFQTSGTNFVLNFNSAFTVIPKVAAATANMTDWSRCEYDWRRRIGGGGSGDYRQLRSTTTRSAVVLPTRTEFGRRDFSVCEPNTWNSLPVNIRLRPID